MNAHEIILEASIKRLEKAFKKVQELAHRAHTDAMGLTDGPAPPSLALMDLAVRSLNQANDAARYARHALHLKG